MIIQILSGAKSILVNTGKSLYGGAVVVKRHPQILLYPYLAALFILITYPIVNGFIFKIWSSLSDESIFVNAGEGPEFLRVLLGLVAFSAFYAIFVTAYFNVAMAAGTRAGLEGHKVSFLYGIREVVAHFLKVTKFALLAVFFFPLSIIAQRKKPLKAIPGVIGSSLSMSMAQLSPVILNENLGVMDSIRKSVDTLGKSWKENIIIKILTWTAIFVLLSVGFLPQFVQDHWVDADTAQLIGALTAILLSFTAYVVTKVVGSLFTAVLYHRASNKKASKKMTP